MDVSNALISDLRAILNGNGLGKFEGTPSCTSWFGASPPERSLCNTDRSDDARPKHQKTVIDSSEIEHKKMLGILTFNALAAGTSHLPTINIYAKKRGA
jgi:hypothetical protein